jgi:hypothetical protein
MPKRESRRVLVLECIPKGERKSEAAILDHFLRMVFYDRRDRVTIYRVTGKTQLLNYLEKKRDLDEYQFIHFSAHGEPEEDSLRLPRGHLLAGDLRLGCFEGKTVSFSSCAMGRKSFATQVIERTGASNMIAPLHDVFYADAALWFMNFYYLVLDSGYSPKSAFQRVNGMLSDKIKGGFRFYYGKEEG